MCAQMKVKLNISQLTLAKLTQSGSNGSVTQVPWVPGSIPTGGNFTNLININSI